MKITDQILSIPPYLSTSWENIGAIHMENGALVVVLVDGGRVPLPHLDDETIERIFKAHETYLEQSEEDSDEDEDDSASSLSFPFNLAMSAFDNMGQILQHNPEQRSAPSLPHEMLERVASVVGMLQPSDLKMLPTPEDGCNCFHCQIARAMQGATGQHAHIQGTEDVEVSDDDLRFRSWDIEQLGDQLYKVQNPLDQSEVYQVFLGKPVGCTCGKEGCEHIEAVLRSE